MELIFDQNDKEFTEEQATIFQQNQDVSNQRTVTKSNEEPVPVYFLQFGKSKARF